MTAIVLRSVLFSAIRAVHTRKKWAQEAPLTICRRRRNCPTGTVSRLWTDFHARRSAGKRGVSDGVLDSRKRYGLGRVRATRR